MRDTMDASEEEDREDMMRRTDDPHDTMDPTGLAVHRT